MKNPRSALTSAFKGAWESTVSKYYNIDGPSPTISSEAALQAYFLVELTAMIAAMEKSGNIPSDTRVFIEPATNSKSVIPDMIVCRNKSVIAVVELKYTPRVDMLRGEEDASSGVKKDLDSFERLYEMAQSENAISPSFLHDRYRGKFAEQSEEFTFSKRTLFIWAGFHSASSKSLKEIFPSRETLQRMPVFEMHANTQAGGEAFTTYFFDGRKEDGCDLKLYSSASATQIVACLDMNWPSRKPRS